MTLSNPDRDLAMVQAYRAGTPRSEIAAQFDVSAHTVYGALKRLGMKPNSTKRSEAISAGSEQRTPRNPVWVDTRMCPCCGVRALVHDDAGCKRWCP